MEYTFIKKVDRLTLQADINATELKELLVSVNTQGNIIKINTTLPLSNRQLVMLRNTIISSKVISDTELYIKGSVMPGARQFATQLETDFIAENILMGISQLNKTAAVLGVLAKKVPIPGEPERISLVDTLKSECPSLTVTIKVLDWHIDNIGNYMDLSPFITVARLTILKNKIKKYLGI